MSLDLISPAFDAGADIPRPYTCDGKDVSPPLAWRGIPDGTRSLALIVDDPDAPDPRAPRTEWVHWILFNLPPDIHSLPEGMDSGHLPDGACEGLNDWKRTGWRGPCPPIGRHRYRFTLVALDTELPGLNRPDREALEAAMQGHVLGKTVLVGHYGKRH